MPLMTWEKGIVYITERQKLSLDLLPSATCHSISGRLSVSCPMQCHVSSTSQPPTHMSIAWHKCFLSYMRMLVSKNFCGRLLWGEAKGKKCTYIDLRKIITDLQLDFHKGWFGTWDSCLICCQQTTVFLDCSAGSPGVSRSLWRTWLPCQ